MKKTVTFLFLISVSFALCGQWIPDWLDDDFRQMKYPESSYFTGFAYGEVLGGKTLQDVTQQMKTDAQADLSREIRMQITSHTQSEIAAVSANGQYRENESFSNRSFTESSAELTGVKTETYYDAKTRTVYAFASVNRYELTGYHKSNLAMNLAQIESLLQTAQNLEQSGEKSQARQQCEAAKSLLVKVRSTQDFLTALDANISPDDLQQSKTESLHSRLVQMQARLAQATLVYMECSESNFAKPATVVCNQLRAALSGKGCSVTDDPAQADFRIQIGVTTRRHSEFQGFTTCYADVTVNLFDVRKNKSVFQDEFSQKGISTSQEAAGRKALEDAAPTIAEKISSWIN
jgi:hypothetical protein